MTHLSLTPTGRSGYGVKRRSPSAMAAAIVFNGGVIALLLAMPGVQIAIQEETQEFFTRNIPEPKDPPPEQQRVEKKEPLNFAKSTEQVKQQDDPYIPETVVPTGGTTEFTGTRDPDPVIVQPPLPPLQIRKPVYEGPSRDPRYASAFTPPYPVALQREGLEGSATVRITINEQGRVIACELVKATNRAFFEETREQALKRWRFRPATSDGVPVQSQQTLTVHFQLDA